MSLVNEYERINTNHKKAIQIRLARIAIGSSVGRVFQKDTVREIWPILTEINLDAIKKVGSQAQYKKWFERQLSKLATKIKKTNPNNKRIYPGYKWGHATKILNLFLRDIILHSRYFAEKDADKIQYFLYVPVDSIVINRLTKLGEQLPFKRIKEIDTQEKFYCVQDILGRAAKKAGAPRIWFDDNWGDRQND